jgi:hypothetical protein
MAIGSEIPPLAEGERAAGVAVVPRAPLLALRGPAALLASFTAQLTGGRRRMCAPVRVRYGWWQPVSAHRSLLLADTDEQRSALIDDLVRGTPDVAVEDLSARFACVVVSGPLAERLETDPAAQLVPTLMTVCGGVQQRLLVVPAPRADTLRAALSRAAHRHPAVQVNPHRQEPVP